MLKLPNYVITRKLGRGSYGEVYLASQKSSDRLVAIKCIPKTKLNKRAQDNLISEISILQKLRHPHVVRLLDFSWDSERVYLFMEYCAGGDLSQFIRLKRYLPEQLVRRFLRQLALALQYLKKKNIIHMDLKPQNILLTSSSNPVLKVTDFGFAQKNSETVKTNELRGTLLYMAPEIYCEGLYHPSCDLWSVGVILYECLFGSPPYASCDTHTLKTKLVQNQAIELPSAIPVSADCAALLRGLLKRDPNERMTHEEFFAHPFVDLKHAPSAQSLDKALEYLEHAVELEKHCDLKQAHENYIRGLAHLVSAIEYESSPAERVELRQLAVRYFEQAEKVKKQLLQERSSSNLRPHRPPPPASLLKLKKQQNNPLLDEGLSGSSESVICPTQVTVQCSPKSQFSPRTTAPETLTTVVLDSTAPLDQTDPTGSNSYFGSLYHKFRQFWVSETKTPTTEEESSRLNSESSFEATGCADHDRVISSERVTSFSISTRPPRPPVPAHLDMQPRQNQATEVKDSQYHAGEPLCSVSCGSRDLPDVMSRKAELPVTTLPSESLPRPISNLSQFGSRTYSSVDEQGRSNASKFASMNVTDLSLVDPSRLDNLKPGQRSPRVSVSDLTMDDKSRPWDLSHAYMTHSVSDTECVSSSRLFNSVPSNLTEFDVDQINDPATSSPPSTSVSLRNSLVTGARDCHHPEKLTRLRQLTFHLSRQCSDIPKGSIEISSEPRLPEIPEQQMALLMDTERLCELESLCGATDESYLCLVDNLKEFYDLFRSNQYNEAFHYFQSNFGAFLKIAKADTNETRRRAFMKELKLVLDLVEGIQQQQEGTPSNQSHSLKTGPIVPSIDPDTLHSPELGVEMTEDSVPSDQCSPS